VRSAAAGLTFKEAKGPVSRWEDLLCRQIVETDRRYFEMGARIAQLPGAEIAWMPGLAHCPSAVVVHRVTASSVARQGPAWVRLVEKRLQELGAASARVYLDEPDTVVAGILGAAGYQARREIALGASRVAAAGKEIRLRQVDSREDWQRKLQFHEAVPERPDGHGASAADWVDMERSKCSLGMRTFLAWRDGEVVGTIGVIPSAEPWRLKNIVVHSDFRRQSVGRGMISRMADRARKGGASGLCLFGIEGTVGEALYRACGFAETGCQIEWTRDFG
jgi:GNAT superfamily N-acetyltransferase